MPLLDFPSVDTGPNANTPQATCVTKYQLRDDFTLADAASTRFKFGAQLHPHEAGRLLLLRRLRLHGAVVRRPAGDREQPRPSTRRASRRRARCGNIQYAAGEASHDQTFHQLAFYVQDDWRVTQKLTLNLGLRWDANIGNLPDQTNNRTMEILQQLDDPRAQAITSDPDKLARTTPSWTRVPAAHRLRLRRRRATAAP